MSKRPAFQFYPSDWRTEQGLRLCSMGARGLWIEMMCLMHEAVPYGHLTHKDAAMPDAHLAKLTGESVPAVKRWLAELADNDVFSVTGDGIIFSRRMVRDEALREARAAGGSAGGEHGGKGASHGGKGGRPRKQKTPLGDDGRGVSEPPLVENQKPPPSSSSPSSASHTPPEVSGGGDTRGSRLPSGFSVPDDWIAWAVTDRGWSEKAAREEAAAFSDHWPAKSGREAVKLDWQATWRNWCRNSRRTADARRGATVDAGW